MRLLVFLVCCIIATWADSLAEETEVTSNKLSSSKLNSIQSSQLQKTSISQQPQQQQQYVPQYIFQQKPVSVIPQHVQQQPPAMYILAQPGGGSTGSHSPLFQQAVHQLLSYYNNNPQARLQLLQQQGGIPQNIPQSPLPSSALPSGHLPSGGLPSGGLHVVPSPQLEQNLGHLTAVQAGSLGQQSVSGPQHVYAVPAQSAYSLSPGLLAQLSSQSLPSQHIPTQQISAQHLVAQQIPSHHLPQQFIAQPMHHSQQFATQYTQQLPTQYTLSPQLAASLQGQSGLGGNIHIGGIASQGQFGLKQSTAGAQVFNSNDFVIQGDKSSQGSGNNYTPIYRTAYVKG